MERKTAFVGGAGALAAAAYVVTTLIAAPQNRAADTAVVAFVADQRNGKNDLGARQVLRLVRANGAELLVVSGDLDYGADDAGRTGDPATWEAMIDAELGAGFPVIATAGDHELMKRPNGAPAPWPVYQQRLLARARQTGIECSGDYGLQSACTYRGMSFVSSAVLMDGRADHAGYVATALAAAPAGWRVCVVHQSLRWYDAIVDVYDACRAGGAVIAAGHQHLYLRSHAMANFRNRAVAENSGTYRIDGRASVAWVSGLGGKSVDGLKRVPGQPPPMSLWLAADKWATRRSADDGAQFGALVCRFGTGRATCEFRELDGTPKGKVVDSFVLVRDGAVVSPPPKLAPAPETPVVATPLPPPPVVATPPVVSAGSLTLSSSTASPLGMNLYRFADFSRQWILADAFKQTRWVSGKKWGDWNCLGANGQPLPLALDANGWVTSLGVCSTGAQQVADTNVFSGGAMLPGHYVVKYNGQGVLKYSAPKVSSAPGRDVVNVPATGNFWLQIESTNASNYIRDIRVYMPGGSCTEDPAKGCATDADCTATCIPYETGQRRFHHSVLANVRGKFSIVRYMDMMCTNGPTSPSAPSPWTTWSSYPTVGAAQWNGVTPANWQGLCGSLPAEIIAEFSEATNTDPWVNIPHRADDNWVTTFAQTLLAGLSPGRRVYVEHSNEVWNFVHAQHDIAAQRCPSYQDLIAGCQADTIPGNGVPCDGFPQSVPKNQSCFQATTRGHSERTVEAHNLFAQVFGASRVVRALAWQPDVGSRATVLGWNNAGQNIDAYAVPAYFGDLLTANMAQSWTVDQIYNYLDQTAINASIGRVVSDAGWLATNWPGISLVAYEGGQHLVATGNSGVTAKFVTMNRDPRMSGLTTRLLDGWKAAGGTLFLYYAEVSPYGDSGMWGAREYEHQALSAAPKAQAVEAWSSTPCWWPGCTP